MSERSALLRQLRGIIPEKKVLSLNGIDAAVAGPANLYIQRDSEQFLDFL